MKLVRMVVRAAGDTGEAGQVEGGVRPQFPQWANDALGKLRPAAGGGQALEPARRQLRVAALEQAVADADLAGLRWALKQVVAHEIGRIQAGPKTYVVQDMPMILPAIPERALECLGLMVRDELGDERLARWAVEEALRRHPERQDQPDGLEYFVEGGAMPETVDLAEGWT